MSQTLRRFVAAACAVLAAGAVSACTQVRDAVPLGGSLNVLGPDQPFIAAVSAGELPAGWEISGSMPADALSVHQIGKFKAINIKADGPPFALTRRTNASLLATPFLSWAWHTQPPGSGMHPVRIIVGLADRVGKPSAAWWQLGGADAGKVTRIIEMAWNETALGRGTVIGPRADGEHPESARYVARGGGEQANRWWVDAVDLSLIHRQVWPGDDQANMDIRFIGIAVHAARTPATMNVAAIRLMR